MSIPTQPGYAPPDTTTGAPAAAAPAPDPADAAAADIAGFDLDAWIAAVDRPEGDVRIYNPVRDWQARCDAAVAAWRAASDALAAAQHAHTTAAAEAAQSGGEAPERAITDPLPQLPDLDAAAAREQDTATALLALRNERDATALVVRCRQVLHQEWRDHMDALPEDMPGIEKVCSALATLGLVSLTPPGGTAQAPPNAAQLLKLYRRDATGAAGVDALQAKLNELGRPPTVPSWPGSSTSRGTGTPSER